MAARMATPVDCKKCLRCIGGDPGFGENKGDEAVDAAASHILAVVDFACVPIDVG